MKKIALFTLVLTLMGTLTAHAGFKIGPFLNYGIDLSSVSVPGVASVTNSGFGGGLKVGYGLNIEILELDFGVLGGYQLRTSKSEVLGVSSVENNTTSIPVMAYAQAIVGGPYLIGGIGMDNMSFSSKSTVNGVVSVDSESSNSGLALMAGAGYSIPVGPSSIELQGAYHTVVVDNTSSSLFTVSAGFNFGL